MPVKFGGGAITPFAGARVYRISSGGFTEAGGGAALQGADNAHWSGMSELGSRVTTLVGSALWAYGKFSWQHRFGSFDDPIALSFLAGGPQFEVRGAQLSRDAAAFGLGLGWKGPGAISISVGYDGVIGGQGHDNAGRVILSVPF